MKNTAVIKMEDLPKGKAFIVDDTAFLDKDGNVIDAFTELQSLDDGAAKVHLVSRVPLVAGAA